MYRGGPKLSSIALEWMIGSGVEVGTRLSLTRSSARTSVEAKVCKERKSALNGV